MLSQESEEGSGEEQEGRGGGVVSFVAKNYDPTLQMKKKKRKDADWPEEPAPKKWKGRKLPLFLYTHPPLPLLTYKELHALKSAQKFVRPKIFMLYERSHQLLNEQGSVT